MLAEGFGDFGENAFDFAQLVFAQAHELVIEADGFERLENSVRPVPLEPWMTPSTRPFCPATMGTT